MKTNTTPTNTKKPIIIAHLYPREMNIYGDIGNIITLKKRLEWRGYSVHIKDIEIGEKFDFKSADIVFGGGGQDRGQLIVGEDLLARKKSIQDAASDGVPMLLVCGLYQLFGHNFKTIQGREIKGIDVFDATTIGSTDRMVGNIVIDSPFGRIVGFENHSGQTTLGTNQAWLGKVRHGYGNNIRRKHEGAIIGNVIGTYMHGPVLPKNPSLADYLILKAFERRGDTESLQILDDSIELAAATSSMTRPQ